ncbi:VIT family protein [Solirubrobacter ginsenosidimutans]|uniref:VIT family protein n=1 Tax=Solirubrobacter ginsenosidimutans TaxID=490573 RepID=A0A9X3MUR8_9ACTN|nr:VIT family protein [Solirubrobacter ginsenosidimutans]MDA0161658.1 VIT family protein [Solirubrobacter ginsenosidimutans]
MSASRRRHREVHLGSRSNWLRAAVLGANDGILSTASLVLGVAGAGGSSAAVLTAGIAGMVAGALSMAAGEYVSVSSQRDTEEADLRLERRELAADPAGELRELAGIYRARGLPADLAQEVAAALTAHGALEAHSRDELGLEQSRRARPLQAAGSSAAAFSAGAILPLGAAALASGSIREGAVVVVTLLALALLGATGARLGGAPPLLATGRVLLWGSLAMAITYAIGVATGGVV